MQFPGRSPSVVYGHAQSPTICARPGRAEYNGGVGPVGGRIDMAKRRQFTPEFKARVVLDILTGVQSQAEACRKHSLGANLVALWKTAFLERAHLVFDSEAARSAEQVRIAELEQ